MVFTMFKKHIYSASEIISLCVAVDEAQGHRYIKSRETMPGEKANFSIMLEALKGNSDLEITDAHRAKAAEIIDYFEGLVFKAIQRNLSPFEQKIVDLIKAEDINVSGSDDRLPIAPSLPNVYRNNLKHDDWSDTERSLRDVSDYVGVLRERCNFVGTVGMSRYMAKTNSVLVAVIVDNKHIVKFFYDLSRSGDVKEETFTPGNTVEFTGYVKSHEVSDYSRCKETFVNRVAISS